jgi:4-amino-4-deoxy-L-arabinose transferase-like glycosyltransferase
MTGNRFLSGNFGIVLIFILAAAIRFVGIGEKQLWIDEIIQVIHSSPDSLRGILNGVAQDRGGAPLDYIVQHYVMKAFGSRLPLDVAARFHAFVFGSISIVLIYVLCLRLLKNRRIAVLSAVLYAFFPFHHHYSQEGRPYALFVLLILALFILYLRAQGNCSWPTLFAMMICGAMAYYTQPFTALFFVVLVSINLFQLKAGKLQRINLGFFAPLISGIAGAFLFVPWVAYSVGNTRGDFAHPISLRLIPEAIQGLGDGSYPVSIILLSLAALGAVHLKKTGSDALTHLFCWILVPVPIILIILHWRSYFFSARQLIFITPAIVILAACGIERLLDRYGKKAMAIPAIYIGISLVVIGLHYPDRRIDFRSAGNYLKQEVISGDRIVAPNSLGILSFYFPKIYGYENSTLECKTGCRRLIFIDTEYANPAETDALKTVQATMVLQKKVEYRGISILEFRP